MLVKNLSFHDALLRFPWIATHELTKFLALLFSRPSALVRALYYVARDLPVMLQKRHLNLKKAS